MAFCLAMGRPNGPIQTVCAPLRAASIKVWYAQETLNGFRERRWYV